MAERGSGPDRFRPDELGGEATVGEQAEALATARELEWLAAADDIAPTAGFADRVMAAVAAEPTPRPVVAAASAARRGALLGVLAAFRDLWRVAWTGGRPLAVRAPAMAMVLILLAGMLGAGALGVGAMVRLVQAPSHTPEPTEVVEPTLTPGPTLSPPSTEPTLEGSPEPTETTEPSESSEPTEAPEPPETARPGATPEPTEHATPRPTRTPRPTESPEATKTPNPSQTPDHSETPEP
jgi:hypothetical protein